MTTTMPALAPEEVVETTPDYRFYDHPEEYAHYIKKSDQMPGYVEGVPVEALCGYVWVPSKDPNNKPICQGCKNVYEDPEARSIIAGWRGKND